MVPFVPWRFLEGGWIRILSTGPEFLPGCHTRLRCFVLCSEGRRERAGIEEIRGWENA